MSLYHPAEKRPTRTVLLWLQDDWPERPVVPLCQNLIDLGKEEKGDEMLLEQAKIQRKQRSATYKCQWMKVQWRMTLSTIFFVKKVSETFILVITALKDFRSVCRKHTKMTTFYRGPLKGPFPHVGRNNRTLMLWVWGPQGNPKVSPISWIVRKLWWFPGRKLWILKLPSRYLPLSGWKLPFPSLPSSMVMCHCLLCVIRLIVMWMILLLPFKMSRSYEMSLSMEIFEYDRWPWSLTIVHLPSLYWLV